MADTKTAVIALAVASASVSALMWWMTREAAAGRIRRSSRTFGIRTRRSRASDRSWVRAHEVALPWTLAGRYATGLLAIGTLVAVGDDREATIGLALGLGAVAAVLLTYLGAVVAITRALPEGGLEDESSDEAATDDQVHDEAPPA